MPVTIHEVSEDALERESKQVNLRTIARDIERLSDSALFIEDGDPLKDRLKRDLEMTYRLTQALALIRAGTDGLISVHYGLTRRSSQP